MEDLGPLLGQSPVEQDRPRLLCGIVHREILADHDAEDMSEQTWLQSTCRAWHTRLPLTATEKEEQTKGKGPRDGEGARRGRKQQKKKHG